MARFPNNFRCLHAEPFRCGGATKGKISRFSDGRVRDGEKLPTNNDNYC